MCSDLCMPRRVAVALWRNSDGVGEDICHELTQLGYLALPFMASSRIPSEAEVVITYGPWGPLLNVLRQAEDFPNDSRPVMVHWNLENPADIAMPWTLLERLSLARSWLGRVTAQTQSLRLQKLLYLIDRRLMKFRYLGDYIYASRKGWVNVIAETSQLFTGFYRTHGIPAFYVPWGTAPGNFANLELDRDIDVLWLGKLRTRRRRNGLHQIRRELAKEGVTVYVADGVENPLVFGHKRTELLNRAKIAVQIMLFWYDNSFHMRFHMVAGNRCMLVSEPLPPHYPDYSSGRDFVASNLDDMAHTILHYLRNEDERLQIAENAYRLVTTRLTFNHSVQQLMTLAGSIK